MAKAAKRAKTAPANPPSDCRLCPRLAQFRNRNRKAYPDYFNGATPSAGSRKSSLLIVGLAPGLHGANRTARPFMGDSAGDLLYATLEKFGFSTGTYASDRPDSVKLRDTMITNAVRCVPPQNKPTGAEIKVCRQFLTAQFGELKGLRAVLCLGRIAHDSTLAALGLKAKDAPFSHGASHRTENPGVTLFDSFHCSRYNTNTRRLTPDMFEAVFAEIRTLLDKS